MKRTESFWGILWQALAVSGGIVLWANALADSPDTTTRISDGVQVYWVEQVAGGLQFPSAIGWLPNGDALIPERIGRLRALRGGRLDPEPIRDAPATFFGVFNGFKDIQVDPDFPVNQFIYLLMSEGTYDRHYAAVYRAQYLGDHLEGVERIFRSKDEIGGVGQSAARMLFLPDKTLLVGVPEDDQHKLMAQRLDSHIGKILRIDRNGSVPSDNPFLHSPGALPEIWCYGVRVPLGLYQDPESSDIWEVEGGPYGGDKLNLLKAGANYGWAKTSWGFAYEGGLAAPLTSAPGVEDPILIWMPSQDPAGFTRYRGSVYPLWDGDYFVGHLPTNEIERLRIRDHRVILQEKMLGDLRERIREVKQGPDHHLYILTDNQNGRLLRLRPGNPGVRELSRVARRLDQNWGWGGRNIYANVTPGDPVKGKHAFLERCAGCHSVGSIVEGGHIGPDLAGVYGRNAGSRSDFHYSSALATSSQAWTFIRLDLFLTDPGRYAPGTSMSAPPIDDMEVRRQIVGFLQQESESQTQKPSTAE